MSSTFNVNNTKYFTNGKLTMLIGTMDTKTNPPHSIFLPHSVTGSSHVVLDKYSLGNFRNYMENSPVSGLGVYAYDQLGNLVSRYEPGRKTNATGSLPISVEPVTLLNNVVFPKVPDDETIYLVLNQYRGLTQVVSPSLRLKLVKEDFDKLITDENISKVHLYITDVLLNMLKEAMPEINLHYFYKFKTVTVGNEISIIQQLVETLSGKVVSGHLANFQGFMNFGSNFEVLHSNVLKDKDIDSADVILTNRRGGRIQVNVSGNRGACSFLVILKNNNEKVLPSFVEERTDTVVSVTEEMLASASTFPGLSMIYLRDYLETVEFQENIHGKKKGDIVAYIKENPHKVVRYMFTNPHLLEEENEKTLTSVSHMIYSDFGILINNVRNTMDTNRANYNFTSYPLGLKRQNANVGLGLGPTNSCTDDYIQQMNSMPLNSFLSRIPTGTNY